MPLRRIPPSDGAQHLVRVRGNVSVMLNNNIRILSPTIYDAPNKLIPPRGPHYAHRLLAAFRVYFQFLRSALVPSDLEEILKRNGPLEGKHRGWVQGETPETATCRNPIG
eukprot:CAMPEP_0198223036 /NCGR_PEP_ID=MMETSP1445-20131203/90681_1 /TAXON_ID=36898 /ORGANISM="Pyramimonas sp., Strain CCMP2087" /LENGTH=109 /DNA_ID=CAMNT_0043901749 /DNA_START=190 /DNA_END=519 /DNA_ORIENTATION=+